MPSLGKRFSEHCVKLLRITTITEMIDDDLGVSSLDCLAKIKLTK
jgi:hypothetical protein